MSDNHVDLDREQAFLLYATFCGDIVRTAHALNIPPEAVIAAAEDGGWATKLKPILALKQSTKPGDVERAMNRALNFVQAHQLRLFVARVIKRLTNMTEDELEEYMLTATETVKGVDMTRSKLTTRPLADLASAMEKCQAMSYLALNDTGAERLKRNESGAGDSEISASDMHARIAAAMAEVGAINTPRQRLLDAQVATAQELAREVGK